MSEHAIDEREQEDKDREAIAKATRDRRITAILTGCFALVLGVIDVMVRWDLANAHMSTDWVDLLDLATVTAALAAVVIASNDWSRRDRVAMVARRAWLERKIHADLRTYLTRWADAAQTEVMSAFGEILAADARHGEADKVTHGHQQLIMERQRNLAEVLGRALADLSMHLGGALADLGTRMAERQAAAEEAQQARMDTLAEQLFKRLDQIESGVVDMATAFEAGQQYRDITSSVPAVEPRPRLVAGEN